MPASKQERRLAFGLIALVWLAFAVMAPFAHMLAITTGKSWREAVKSPMTVSPIAIFDRS
jgi:hypothetical protein